MAELRCFFSGKNHSGDRPVRANLDRRERGVGNRKHEVRPERSLDDRNFGRRQREILEEVGEDNIFIFGQTVEGIENLRSNGYEPRKHYETDEELKAVLDWLSSDYFSPKEGNVLEDLPKSLLDWGDPFFVLADYRAYVEAQEKVNSAYLDQDRWASMAIRNVAGSGKFSSDRTIGEYASDIWKLDPLKVPDQVS